MLDAHDQVNNAPDPLKTSDDRLDMQSIWVYLQTPQGHEVAKRVLEIFDDLKKMSINKGSYHQSLETTAKYVIIGTIVAAVYFLSVSSKLDPTTGMLLGTIVGYFFGRKEEL